MRVISRKKLKSFWEKHADSEIQLRAWFREAQQANWITPVDVLREYPFASIVSGNRIVFNIKGNRYRLIVKVRYQYHLVYIRFIGTHSEYDNINAETI